MIIKQNYIAFIHTPIKILKRMREEAAVIIKA